MKRNYAIYLSLILALSLSAKAFNIVSPEEGEIISTGSVYNIKWEKEPGMFYEIMISYDGGTYYKHLVNNLDNDNFDWHVPQEVYLGAKLKLISKVPDIFEIHKKLDYGIPEEVHSVKIHRNKDHIEVLAAFDAGEIIIKDLNDNTIWEFMPPLASMLLLDADISSGLDTIAASYSYTDNMQEKYGVLLIDRASKKYIIIGSDLIKKQIQSVALHPAEAILIAGSYEGKVYLFDFEGNLIDTYQTNDNSEVYHVSFSDDGSKIDFTSRSGHTYVIDYPDGSNRKVFSQHGFQNKNTVVWSADIAGDNSIIVTGGVDGSIKKWDMDTEVELFRKHLGSTHVRSVQLTNDGKYIISGSLDNRIRLFQNYNMALAFEGVNEHQVLTSDVFKELNTYYIVTGLRNGGVNIWRLDEGVNETSLLEVDIKHFIDIELPEITAKNGETFDFSPDISSNNPRALQDFINGSNLNLKLPYTLIDLSGYNDYEIRGQNMYAEFKVAGIPLNLQGLALIGSSSKGNITLEKVRFEDPVDSLNYEFTIKDGSINVLPRCHEAEYGILVHPDSESRLQVAPNPAENDLGVRLNIIEEGNYRLYMTDMQGNNLKEYLNKELIEQKYEFNFSLNDIPSGNYYLILEYKGRKAEKKISVVK
ncbi:MAG: T9SS type A sorting domain-containing protein [Candidatus Kapaibacterium sp.]